MMRGVGKTQFVADRLLGVKRKDEQGKTERDSHEIDELLTAI
jgi:hypothetical protein